MKKLLIYIALAGIIFAGCSDLKINNVNQPEQGTYKLIPIPQKNGLSTETAYTTTKTIDGSIGDTMSINASYIGNNGMLVTLNLTMTIPAGAFSDVKTITLTADDQYAAVRCSPAMIFDKSLQLDYTYTGLDIKSLNLPKHTNGFYFISDSGNLEAIASTDFLIDSKKGILSVTGAQINHFSRYGWSTLD